MNEIGILAFDIASGPSAPRLKLDISSSYKADAKLGQVIVHPVQEPRELVDLIAPDTKYTPSGAVNEKIVYVVLVTREARAIVGIVNCG